MSSTATKSETPIVARENRVRNNVGSWHNRSGEGMRMITNDVWVIERGYDTTFVDVGGKTTIIRLPDNRLFIHSPLPVDPNVREEIKNLGTVSAVIAPNDQHIDFVKTWKHYFPEAKIVGPPGIKQQKPDFPFDSEIDKNGLQHESYKDDNDSIKQVYIQGAPFMNETVFYHQPSKTLITTDLFTSLPVDTGIFLKARHMTFGRFFRFLYRRVICTDRATVEKGLEEIEKWEFERIIPCHGDVVEENALSLFKQWHERE